MESTLPSFRKLLESVERQRRIEDLPAGSIVGIDAKKVMIDCVQIQENSWDLQTGGISLAEKFLVHFINDIQKHGIKCVFVFSGLSLPRISPASPSKSNTNRQKHTLTKQEREKKVLCASVCACAGVRRRV